MNSLKRFWQIGGGRKLDLTSRGLIMGILNVTVDSFSDGGKFLLPDAALTHALAMEAEGAGMIDIGGESTRPGAIPVSEEVELERVIPVLDRLRGNLSCPLSIDTSKAAVARAAIQRGAAVINDVTGLRGDPAMAPLAAESGAGLVIMHMQRSPRDMQVDPRYGDVVAEVGDFFRQSFRLAIGCGVDPAQIVFDPGIGFGKSVHHNLLLLKNLDSLRIENRPILVGVSRKGFLGKLIARENIADRFWPAVALTSLAREHGARLFRVHDVKPNLEALRMTEAILNGTDGP